MPSYYDRVFSWGIENQGRLDAQTKVEGRIDLWRRFLDESEVTPRSVIDIGANDGSLALRMSAAGVGTEFTLVDISKAAVEYIQSHPFPELVDAQVADAYSLPYADSTFDLAVLSHTVEHLAHPRDAIVEAARVAKSVLVEVPLQDAFLSNIAGVVRKLRTGMPRSLNAVGHVHFFTDRTFRVGMTEWDEVQILRSLLYIPSSSSRLRSLLRWLGPQQFGKLLSVNAIYLIAGR